MAGPDYILDISGLKTQREGDGPLLPTPPASHAPVAAPAEQASAFQGRPWLAIHWRCCSVYSRIYRDAAGVAYHGRCPRCAKPLHVAVGEGGTNARFFEAS